MARGTGRRAVRSAPVGRAGELLHVRRPSRPRDRVRVRSTARRPDALRGVFVRSGRLGRSTSSGRVGGLCDACPGRGAALSARAPGVDGDSRSSEWRLRSWEGGAGFECKGRRGGHLGRNSSSRSTSHLPSRQNQVVLSQWSGAASRELLRTLAIWDLAA